MDLDWNGKTGLTIQIQNPILTLDCQSQSNPLNWIAIRIEQSSNPIQQYPVRHLWQEEIQMWRQTLLHKWNINCKNKNFTKCYRGLKLAKKVSHINYLYVIYKRKVLEGNFNFWIHISIIDVIAFGGGGQLFCDDSPKARVLNSSSMAGQKLGACSRAKTYMFLKYKLFLWKK